MADDEPAIEHGEIRTATLQTGAIGSVPSITGVDSELQTNQGSHFIQNKAVHTELQARMPREYNVRVSGDFKTTTGGFATEIQDTFPVDPHGRIDNNNGVGIKIPVNGVYFSNLNLDMTSDAEETVLKLQPQGYFQLGGSASDFQQNASFSVDFEWRGTSLATTVANPTPTTDADGMASTSIPLLATAKTGNRFRLLASKASDSAYALKLECSDGTLVRELDAGTLNVGEWYHIVVSWASQQNTMSVQVGEQRYQDDDAPPEFGSNTSRPFTFGTDDNGTTTGGGFEYRYVRFHQRVLTEEDIRALVPVSRDVDIHNFRSAIVYNADLDTEAEATITKHGPANSWSVATVPSSVGAATLTLKLSTSGGVERTLRTVKISPEAAIGNRNVCQTFLAVAGDIVRFAVGPTTYVDYTTREFCVTGLKFDDIVVPRITLTQPDMVLEKGATYPYRQAGGNTGDLGFTAFEHLSPTPANAAPQPVDRSASVAISGLVDTGAVGRQYVKYTLTSGSTTVTATRSVLIIDETAPVILLTGSNNVNHERGSSYVDAGATVQEGPNVPITVVNGVVADTVSDPNAPYTVTYDAIDASGNRAVRVTRIVHVSDSTAPVIEFGPSKSATAADVTIERLDDSGAFEDPVSARDPPDDRVMTVQVSFLDASDTQLNPNTIAQMVQAAGSYKIIYTCSDGNGNSAAQKQRNVTVQDTTKPRIAVTSPDVMVERLNAYTSLMDGVTAHDYAPDGFLLTTNGKDEATDLTSDVVVTTEAKAFDGTNTWYVTVVGGKFAFVADLADFGTASLLRPEIALTRGVTYIFDQSDASNANHTLAFKKSDGYDILAAQNVTVDYSTTPPGQSGATVSISTTGDTDATLRYTCQQHGVGMGNLMHLQQNDVVFTDTAQKYQIRYDVKDVAENQADTAYRTVTIRDQTTPVITLAVQAFAITVAVDGGVNKYHIDGVTTPQLQLFRGFTYTFRQAENSGHPFRLSTTAGGTHGGGSQYTDGWSENGSTFTFTVPSDAPHTLYYYCQDHNGMGEAMTITTDATGATHDFVGSKAIERVTGSFDDPGFSASDGNVDLTSSVVITNNVDVNTVSDGPNHWHYTYEVTDSSGNSVQKHRRVQVTDSVAPTITLLGSSPVNVTIGGTYAEPGVTVSEGGQTANVTTTSTLFSGPDTVNFIVEINDANGNSATIETGTETTYTVTYTATDHSGNSTFVNRTVQVADYTAPLVTLLSENSNTYEVAQGDSTYVEHGARATDAGQQVDFNSNTTSGGMNLTITGPVDTTTKGTYTVTYTATDANNNSGSVMRTVSVVDTTAPVITINGDNPATVTENDSYTDLGITVVDNSGETVGAGLTVTTSNPVDTSNVGAYTITYVVEDSSLNQATATRTVNVESAMGVQLSGSSTLTLERYASYVEPGAALVQTITTTAVDLDTSDVVDRWPADPSIPNHSWAGPYTSSGTGQGQTLTTSSGNLPSGNEPYSFEFTLQTDGGWGSKMPFWWGAGTYRAMTLFGTSSNSQIGVDHSWCQYLVGLGADSDMIPSDYTGAITIRATKTEKLGDGGVTIMIYHSFDGGTTWHQPKAVYQSPTPNTGPTSMEATNQLHILASPWSPNYDSAGNTTISNIKVWHSVQAVPVYFDLGTAVAAGGGGGDTPLWASSTVYTQASPASDFIINIKQLTGQALPTGTSPWSFQFTFQTDDTTVGWSGTSFLGWGGGAYQAFDSVSCMIWDSANYMVGNELQIEWQGNATQVAMVYCPDITDPVQHEAAWKGNASVGQPHGIQQYYSYSTNRYAGPLATTINTSGDIYYNGAVLDYYIYQFGYQPAMTGFATASHWNNHGHHTGNRYYYDENGVHTVGTPQPGEHTVFVSCDEGSGGTIAAFQHSRTVKVYIDGTHVATSVNTPANAGSAGQPADYLGICGAFVNGYLKTHTGDAEGVNWGASFRDRPATDNVPVNFYARPHGNWTMKDIKIWDAVVEPQVAPVNSATDVSDDWPGTYALTSSNIPRSGTITHATDGLSPPSSVDPVWSSGATEYTTGAQVTMPAGVYLPHGTDPYTIEFSYETSGGWLNTEILTWGVGQTKKLVWVGNYHPTQHGFRHFTWDDGATQGPFDTAFGTGAGQMGFQHTDTGAQLITITKEAGGGHQSEGVEMRIYVNGVLRNTSTGHQGPYYMQEQDATTLNLLHYGSGAWTNNADPNGTVKLKDIKIWRAVVPPAILTVQNAPGSWATLDWAPVRMPFTIEFDVNVATFETFNHFFEFRDDDHTKNTIFCGPTSNNTIAIGGSSTYDAGGDDTGSVQQFLAATKTALSTNQDYAIKLTHDGEQVCVYVDDVKQEFGEGGAAADWQSTQVYNAPTALNLYGSDDTVTSGTAFNMPSGSDAYTIQFTYRKTNGWGGDGMMIDFGGTTAATTWAMIFNTAASWMISTWNNGDTSSLNLSQNFYGMGVPWNSQDWWTIRVTREQGTGARATKVYITKGEATDWTDASIVTALDTTLGEVPFTGDSNTLSIMNGANAYNNANYNQATAEMKDIKIWKGQVLPPEVQIFVGGNDYMSAVKSGIMFCGGPAQRSINTILGSSNSFYNTLGSQTIKSFKVTNSVSSGAVLTHSSDGMTNTAGNMATLKTPLVIKAPFALSTRVKFHTLQPLQHIFQFTNAAPYPATGDGTQNALSLGLTADNKFVFEGNTDGIFHSAITQTTAAINQWYDLRVEHSGASGAVPTFLINNVAQSYDSLSPSADWSGLTGVFPAGGALPASATRLYHYIAGNATDFETSWNYGTMTVEHVTVADGFDMPVVTTITSNNDGTVKSETKMRETPGAYTLTYTAGVLSTTRAITVVDSSAPVFTDGDYSTLTIERGHNYVETAPPVTDPGASGMGVPEPIATLVVDTSVAVNTSVVGDYARVFQATDGVHTVSHTRTVQVRDTFSPVITFLEPNAPDVYLAGPYTTPTSLGSYSGADGPLNDTSGNAYTMPHGTDAYTIEFTFRSTTGEDNTDHGNGVSTFGKANFLNWGASIAGLHGISTSMPSNAGFISCYDRSGTALTFAHWAAPEPTLDLTTQYHGYTRTMQYSSDTSTGADDAIWWTIRATKSAGASALLNVYVTQNGVWDATSIVPVVTDQSIGNPTNLGATDAARLGIMNGGNPFNTTDYNHTGTFAMKDIRIWKSVVVPTTGAASGADSSNPMVINAGQYTAWSSTVEATPDIHDGSGTEYTTPQTITTTSNLPTGDVPFTLEFTYRNPNGFYAVTGNSAYHLTWGQFPHGWWLNGAGTTIHSYGTDLYVFDASFGDLAAHIPTNDTDYWRIRVTRSESNAGDDTATYNMYICKDADGWTVGHAPIFTLNLDRPAFRPSAAMTPTNQLHVLNHGAPTALANATGHIKNIKIWSSVVPPTVTAIGADPGFTAIDTVDNTDLTSSVVVSGPNATDLATGGNYIVTYTLNASGDPAAYGPTVQKNRYVTVYEPPPIPTHYLGHLMNKAGHYDAIWQTWGGTEGDTDYFYELPVLTSDKRTAYFWMGNSHSIARANFAIPQTGQYYYEITTDSTSRMPFFGVAYGGVDAEVFTHTGNSTNVNAWAYDHASWRRYGAANGSLAWQGYGNGPGNTSYHTPTYAAGWAITLGDFWSPLCMYAYGNSIADCRRYKEMTFGLYVWQDAPEQKYQFGMQCNGSGPSEGAARLFEFGTTHGVNGAEVVYPFVGSGGNRPTITNHIYMTFPWPKPELFDNHETNDYFHFLGPQNLTQQHFPPHAENADDEEFTKGHVKYNYMFDAGWRHDKHHLHYVFAQVDGCTDENLIQPTDNPTGLSDDRLSINVTSSNGASKWVAAFPRVPIPYMGQFYRFFDQRWIYTNHGGHADANNNQRYYMEVTVKSNTSRFFIGVVQHLPNEQHNHWQNYIVHSLNTDNAKQWDEAPLRWGWFIDIPNNTCHRVTTYQDGTTFQSEVVSDTGNSLMAGGAPQADDVIGMYFDFGDLVPSPVDDRNLDAGQHFRVTKNGGAETVYQDFGQAIAQNQHVWTGRGYGMFERWPLIAGYNGTHLTCNFGPTFAHPPPNGTGEAYENNPFLAYSSLEHIYNHYTWKNFHGTNRWPSTGILDSSYEACNVLPTIPDGPL